MNRTPFMPPLNSKWRLTRDVELPTSFLKRYANQDLVDHRYALKTVHQWLDEPGNRTTDQEWIKNWHAFDATQRPETFLIPAGTVVSFNRYHASNSGDVQMTLQFIASPDLMLTPKKQGGKGKGHMRFYVNLDEFNSLGELEYVHD